MKKQKTKITEKINPDPIRTDPPKIVDKIVIVKGGVTDAEFYYNTQVYIEDCAQSEALLRFENWGTEGPVEVPIPMIPHQTQLFKQSTTSSTGTEFRGVLDLPNALEDSPDGEHYQVDVILVDLEASFQNCSVELMS